MSAKSKSQFRFMKMMEHNPDLAKKQDGPTPEQAKEFTKGNVGKYRFKRLKEKIGKK